MHQNYGIYVISGFASGLQLARHTVPVSYTHLALDYVRLLPWMQSPDTHLRVNGGLNAWVVPAFHGRVVFVYETEFYLSLGVGLEIVLIAIWILIARRRGGEAA